MEWENKGSKEEERDEREKRQRGKQVDWNQAVQFQLWPP